MKRLSTCFVLVLGASMALAQSASADDRKDNDRNRVEIVRARLVGFEEAPTSVSSPASGWFLARIEEKARKITYWLSYEGFTVDVTMAHLHFGQHRTAGGISVWLCANNPPITNAPTGTQTCPAMEGDIDGTIMDTDVVGPTAQGIAPAEFDELVAAIRAGAVYANVHTTAFPAGEIRGQLR